MTVLKAERERVLHDINWRQWELMGMKRIDKIYEYIKTKITGIYAGPTEGGELALKRRK